MNSTIVNHMTDFIENKERENLASKISDDGITKTDIVNSILNELEREMKNENKQN